MRSTPAHPPQQIAAMPRLVACGCGGHKLATDKVYRQCRLEIEKQILRSVRHSTSEP